MSFWMHKHKHFELFFYILFSLLAVASLFPPLTCSVCSQINFNLILMILLEVLMASTVILSARSAEDCCCHRKVCECMHVYMSDFFVFCLFVCFCSLSFFHPKQFSFFYPSSSRGHTTGLWLSNLQSSPLGSLKHILWVNLHINKYNYITYICICFSFNP